MLNILAQEIRCQMCRDTVDKNDEKKLFGTIRVCSHCYLNALLKIKLRKLNDPRIVLSNGLEVHLK